MLSKRAGSPEGAKVADEDMPATWREVIEQFLRSSFITNRGNAP